MEINWYLCVLLKAVRESRCVSESMNVRLLAAKLPAVGGFAVATHGARGRWRENLPASMCLCVCVCVPVQA